MRPLFSLEFHSVDLRSVATSTGLAGERLEQRDGTGLICASLFSRISRISNFMARWGAATQRVDRSVDVRLVQESASSSGTGLITEHERAIAASDTKALVDEWRRNDTDLFIDRASS